MINKETILSAYDDKLTLLEWLKKVEKGLDEGVLSSCELIKTARATFKLKLSFADGTTAQSNELTIETDDIVSSSFVNGHLVFVTQDGRTIDAGHLSGNLGNVICEALEVHGDVHADGDIYAGGDVNVTGSVNAGNIGEIVEKMDKIADDVAENKVKLSNVSKTQYGLSINEYTTINGKVRVNGGLEVDGQDFVEVEANPQEEGTTDLTKLKVGDSVYNIPSGGATLEKIMDANGNLRFVSGNLTDANYPNIPLTYGKWALSGHVLTIVYCSVLASNKDINPNFDLATFDLPTFIKDNISIIRGSDTIASKMTVVVDPNPTKQQLYYQPLRLVKKTDDTFSIRANLYTAGETMPMGSELRVEFNLVID